jgi:hypothetical protein
VRCGDGAAHAGTDSSGQHGGGEWRGTVVVGVAVSCAIDVREAEQKQCSCRRELRMSREMEERRRAAWVVMRGYGPCLSVCVLYLHLLRRLGLCDLKGSFPSSLCSA